MNTAIILAAGEGTRMGKLKQLLPWGNSTILGTVISNVVESKLIDGQIRIVVGAAAGDVILYIKKQIIPLLKDQRKEQLCIMENIDYRQGMSSSIKTGLVNLPAETEMVTLFLADQPLITPQIINLIIKKYKKERPLALVPLASGKRGHPVVFNTKLLSEISYLNGPGGLRSILNNYSDQVYYYEIDDKRIIIDIDFEHEYNYYLNWTGRQEGKDGLKL